MGFARTTSSPYASTTRTAKPRRGRRGWLLIVAAAGLVYLFAITRPHLPDTPLPTGLASGYLLLHPAASSDLVLLDMSKLKTELVPADAHLLAPDGSWILAGAKHSVPDVIKADGVYRLPPMPWLTGRQAPQSFDFSAGLAYRQGIAVLPATISGRQVLLPLNVEQMHWLPARTLDDQLNGHDWCLGKTPKTIYFDTEDGHLWLYNFDNDIMELVAWGCFPALSPHGDLAYVTRNRRGLRVLTAGGKTRNLPTPRAEFGGVRWSPHGRFLAYLYRGAGFHYSGADGSKAWGVGVLDLKHGRNYHLLPLHLDEQVISGVERNGGLQWVSARPELPLQAMADNMRSS